ncbi:MAG TPA: nitrilase-related carbon-nitrogen hydrolase [Candidatus Krumholzibacteria bacterium]|nr:nitrilase-related carbon-nitrogen hydrolase [Candidatus Krumholzibacteria bacterium]HRX51189.1 nitrilase-related carbon-nitrogen hydrolase [Candidatus Krumholzibacteria bacterium]
MTRLRLAAVQTAPEFGAVDRNVTDALALIPADADLAVLPELFSTGYQFRDRDEALALAEPVDGPTVTRLQEHAAATGTALCAGWAERCGDRVYNSSVLVTPDAPPAVYRKVHLFWNEKTVFAPGDLGLPVQAVRGVTVGMMICFDWVFPEAARTLARRGARVLLHPSNLVLPYCPDAMVTRCLENRVFAVTANRVGREARVEGTELTFIGRSQVCGPQGKVLVRMGDIQAGAATADVDLLDADPRLTPVNDVWEDRRPEAYDLD